jgi:death-on-curing protein
MTEPTRISLELTITVHHRQLAEHGGLEGVRDEGMLRSALARPQQMFHYSDRKPDLPALAAAYAYGIARNHAFVDGNKRTAAVVCETFIDLNGLRLVAENAEIYPMFLGLAEGSITEAQLADWLRAHLARS